MNKTYGYRKEDIIFPYGMLLLIPAIFAYFVLKFPMTEAEAHDPFMIGIFIFIWLLLASLFLPILLWILNNLKTVIVVNDIGIFKKDMFREVVIKWNEITKVDKKYLYEGSYPRYEYQAPSDLLIFASDGRKMQIYKILQSLDGCGEDIVDFEKEIYKRIDPKKQPDTTNYEKNQFRLGILGGILVIIFAVVIGYSPPRHNSGLLGLLIHRLGLRGAAIFIAFWGCMIIAYSIYKLKHFPREDEHEDK